MTHWLLLDTSSLLYRAFFGLPTSIKDPSGQAVNAVHGYLDMTARLYGSRQPDRLTHCYDDVFVPAARAQAYPPYKAHRPEDPPELPPQFGLLEEVLDAFGVERATATAWEADDAIAALCASAAPGDVVEIVTGDRDLLQLVRDDSPTVRVLFTVKGVTDLAAFDEAAVLAKYGVPASRYVDFATLRGDPSDGLPGVPGRRREDRPAAGRVVPNPRRPGGRRRLAAEAVVRADRRRPRHTSRPCGAWCPSRPDVPVELKSGPRDDARLEVLGKARRLGGPIRRLTEALAASSTPA